MTSSQSNPVDFLIVGAAKAGTTTLFETLKKHPGIFIPQRKECQYFSCTHGEFAGPPPQYATTVTRSLDQYRELFKKAEPGQLCGDISPDYLYYYQNAVPKILSEKDAQTPIVIVLRNPIDRAYSNYLHHVRDGREKLSFEDALNAEQERVEEYWPWGWFYVRCGLYAQQVKAYTEKFERVLTLLFEEDVLTGLATGKVLEFLKLPPLVEAQDDTHENISGYPQNRVLHRLMTDERVVRKIKNMIKATPLYARSKKLYGKVMQANLRKEAMLPDTRRMLKEKFEDDVALLAEQTGLPVYEFWKDFR